MFKLVKYELRKQLFSKVVILTLLALLEIGFLVGLFTENNDILATSAGLFIFLSIVTVCFVAFESIFTFSNDLKTKQSYMLFLTPNSTYKIVGAKILTSMLTIIVTAAAFLAVILLNVTIALAKYEMIGDFVKVIQEFMKQMMNAEVNYALVIAYVCYIVFNLIRILIVGMTSITLSATFLSNTKVKGIVSVAFFFGINYLTSKLASLLIPSLTAFDTSPFYYHCLWTLGVVGVFYLLTSFMLDKKVSV